MLFALSISAFSLFNIQIYIYLILSQNLNEIDVILALLIISIFKIFVLNIH